MLTPPSRQGPAQIHGAVGRRPLRRRDRARAQLQGNFLDLLQIGNPDSTKNTRSADRFGCFLDAHRPHRPAPPTEKAGIRERAQKRREPAKVPAPVIRFQAT